LLLAFLLSEKVLRRIYLLSKNGGKRDKITSKVGLRRGLPRQLRKPRFRCETAKECLKGGMAGQQKGEIAAADRRRGKESHNRKSAKGGRDRSGRDSNTTSRCALTSASRPELQGRWSVLLEKTTRRERCTTGSPP